MKNFYVRYEVNEDCPDYVFVVKATTLREAKKRVKEILSGDYPES